MFVDSDSAGGHGRIMPNVDSRSDRFPASVPNFSRGRMTENAAQRKYVAETTPHEDAGRLPQSASDFNLPSVALAAAGVSGRDGIRKSYSEVNLSRENSAGAKPISNNEQASLRQQRRLQKPGKVAVSQYTLPQSPTPEELAQLPKALVRNSKIISDETSKSPKSLSSLARRSSWIIGSRSPSPSNRKLFREAGRAPERSSATASNMPASSQDLDGGPDMPVIQRRTTSSSSRSRRPLSAILSISKSGKDDFPRIPKSHSTDRLPLREYQLNVPEMPTLPSKDRFQASGIETPRKKDELWSIFRSLDGDFQKFSAKPGTLKANAVRTMLLPFLRTYAEHPSWRKLRPEDLDRRANILNKWWTGLLEMLNGRNGQSVSASDRPAVLEGVSAIMSRPEWRIPLSAISSRPSARSKSTSSLESNMTDFLAESVIQNVRNVFAQNLLSQMAFVAQRMSQRSVPASIVTFCGKAAAYAFIYCPGVADILVRLWGLKSDDIRRVLEEHGHARSANLSAAADEVSRHFPSHLQSLSFASVARTARYLRSKPASPLNSAYIAWDGPWKTRWAGKESDLFFCFVKHHSILLGDILPDEVEAVQRLAAPAALLVQAQLLRVIDETIHCTAHDAHPEPFEGPLPITFDDVLGADASAVAIPASAQNPNRSMAENRLMMLLRDFLAPAPTVPEQARAVFADDFQRLLKASAKRISLYDHNACFTLCDLLEEAVVILSRYHKNVDDPGAFLDWSFWLEVLKQMGESENSTTDMRLHAFVYGMWGYIARDAERKRDLCLGWLLDEGYALRHFCHWCPMVRAYYMRLLCWRVLRCDGDAAGTDLELYKAAFQRLRTVWGYFLYLQRQASERRGKFLPTAPAHPAPQRRFLILRNDSGPSAGGGFLSLESMAASAAPSQPGTYNASLESLRQLTASPDMDEQPPAKKRWSAIKGLLPFSSSSSAARQAKQQRQQKEPINEPKRPATLSTLPSHASITPPQHSPGHNVHHSFKFSLEWIDRSLQPRDRKLFPPLLPGPAQQALFAAHPELAPPKPPPQQPASNLGTAHPTPQRPTPPPSHPSSSAPTPSRSASSTPAPTPPQTASSASQSSITASLPPPPPFTARHGGTGTPPRGYSGAQQLTRLLPPPRALEAACKYSGSALAEWAALVMECQGFFERRRAEGVAEAALVETPTLGVESFRRPVG